MTYDFAVSPADVEKYLGKIRTALGEFRPVEAALTEQDPRRNQNFVEMLAGKQPEAPGGAQAMTAYRRQDGKRWTSWPRSAKS